MRSWILLLAAAALAGCSSPEALDGALTLAPNGEQEVNFDVAEGTTFSWEWDASEEVRFNVHSHVNGGLQEYGLTTDTHGDGEHTADAATVYSLMWINPGPTAIDVTYKLTGAVTLV